VYQEKSFCYISSYSNWILGIVYLEELLTDGSMSSACAKRRFIKWPQLPLGHGWTRWNWSCYHLRLNIRNWKGVHWSGKSRFLLRPVDGRIWVWQYRNTVFHNWNKLGTTAFGDGVVTVWWCFSLNCKLDSHVLQGNLNGVAYRDNVLNAHVVSHFNNPPLADGSIFMDDTAIRHRARIVR